jgi:hypothetical protein
MTDFPFHELRIGNEVVPRRPTIEEMGGDPEKLVRVMHGWADACQMRNRMVPPEEFSYADELGTHFLTIYDLIRRLRDSGG